MSQNYIALLNPEHLHTLIEAETQAGRRAALAEGLLRLLALHARHLVEPAGHGLMRVGTIMKMPFVGTTDDLGFAIRDIPIEATGHAFNVAGKLVLNGGLIHHGDGIWGVHT